MSQAFASPTPATAFRRYCARAWADPEVRSTTIGLAAVLLIHLLLFIIAPLLATYQAPIGTARPRSSAKQFNIEIAPEVLEKMNEKRLPQQFVETNPDAPENTPDKTSQFGAHNQQAAQEKPTPDGKSERPALEGKKDSQSTQIVDGQLRKLEERMEAIPPSPQAAPTPPGVAAARAEQNPLPGFDKKQGESEDGFGTNISENMTNVRPIPERVDGARDVPLVDGATGLQPAIDPKRPRPRPQMVSQPQVRPAILAENVKGTDRVGVIAHTALKTTYGTYLTRLIEAVQMSWDGILAESRTYPPQGTWVVVKWVLNAEGKVARIVEVENHSSDYGSRACVNAITSRAPYGAWTDDMKTVLGEEQEITFSFYYQ